MTATVRHRPVVTITPDQSLEGLLGLVRNCRVCEAELPLGPRPVLQAGSAARILIVGPGAGGSRAQLGESMGRREWRAPASLDRCE